MANLWNPNTDYFQDTVEYNAAVPYNDTVYYNGSLELSSVYQPTGTLWSASSADNILDEQEGFVLDELSHNILSEIQDIISTSQPSPVLWLGNSKFNVGAPLYNAAVPYNDTVYYNGLTGDSLATNYVPTGTIWEENN